MFLYREFKMKEGSDMRKTACIVGGIIVSIVAVYCLVLLIVFVMGYADVPDNLETMGVIVLSILTIIGAVIVWVRKRVGAWVSLVIGILFIIFALITAAPYPLSSQLFAMMVSGVPLIIGSILMLWGLKEERA
jgi:hypothetical protein